MMKNTLLEAAALGLPGTLLNAASSQHYGIVGQTAPELTIDDWIDKNGDITSFTLTQHSDKWILLNCFQSWCPGCHAHGFPALKKISEALYGNPDVVFAVIQTVFEGFSTNTHDKLRKTQLQYDLQMPFGHDAGGEDRSPLTMVNYRTGGTPWMILINPEGQVVYNEFNINAEKVIQFLNDQTA